MKAKNLQKIEKEMNYFALYFEHRYFGTNSDDSYWVADVIGEVYSIADYFFNMSDMVNYVRYSYTNDQMFEHYDYALDKAMANKTVVCIRDFKKLIK